MKLLLSVLLVLIASTVFSQSGAYSPAFSFTVELPSDSCVILTWVNVGDDSTIGIADFIDIRYWYAEIDMSNWDSAYQVIGLPSPDSSGSIQSHKTCNIPIGMIWYFAMRAADEVPNWSGISNNVSITLPPKISIYVYISILPDEIIFPDLQLPDTIWAPDSTFYELDPTIHFDSVYPGVLASSVTLRDIYGYITQQGVIILLYADFRYNVFPQDFDLNGRDFEAIFRYLYK